MIVLYERRSRRHAHEYFPTLPLAGPRRYTKGGLECDRDGARLFANSMVIKDKKMQGRGNRRLAMNDTAPSDRIPAVTGETFIPLVLNGQGPIVVEFMSYACAHCAEIEPVLQQVAEIVKSQEQFFRVNTGIERGLAEQYQISGTPTLLMFLNGREVGRVEGPPPIASSILTAITMPFGP